MNCILSTVAARRSSNSAMRRTIDDVVDEGAALICTADGSDENRQLPRYSPFYAVSSSVPWYAFSSRTHVTARPVYLIQPPANLSGRKPCLDDTVWTGFVSHSPHGWKSMDSKHLGLHIPLALHHGSR